MWEGSLRHNPRFQPKTAFWRFSLVHRPDAERQLRVELTRSQLVSRTVAPI
jgi:hypothetical protein